MNALAKADRDKLVSILGLLSSDFDGERSSAALAASRFLKTRKLTWSDVIGGAQRLELPPELARAAEEARSARAAQRGVTDDLRFCVRHLDRLRTWEQQFLQSVAVRTRRSPKQNAVIREIAAGLRTRGHA